jgi:hypothetical protein
MSAPARNHPFHRRNGRPHRYNLPLATSPRPFGRSAPEPDLDRKDCLCPYV